MNKNTATIEDTTAFEPAAGIDWKAWWKFVFRNFLLLGAVAAGSRRADERIVVSLIRQLS